MKKQTQVVLGRPNEESEGSVPGTEIPESSKTLPENDASITFELLGSTRGNRESIYYLVLNGRQCCSSTIGSEQMREHPAQEIGIQVCHSALQNDRPRFEGVE